MNQIERTARLLWEARPVAYYVWSGIEQQSNATQIARAIGQLYALTGSFDAPGGNVLFPKVPAGDISGNEFLAAAQRARALGLAERPLGPSRWLHITVEEIYVSQEAQSLVQLRQRVAEPRGEARSDTEIVFDLACRLGLGEHFWDGDIEAAYRYQLSPSGVSLCRLRSAWLVASLAGNWCAWLRSVQFGWGEPQPDYQQ